MVPEVVVFDLGKVLLDFDYNRAVTRILTRCNVPAEQVRTLIDQSPLLYRYETNLLSTEQFFGEIQAACGFAGDLDLFSEWFSDIFTPIESMVQLHGKLRERGLPTYIFSNTNDLAVRHIRRRYPFFLQFEGHILSYEHGAMKPDAKLYEIVEQTTAKAGRQLAYIDDRAENVAAGAQRGWHAILHVDPDQTAASLQRLGLL